MLSYRMMLSRVTPIWNSCLCHTQLFVGLCRVATRAAAPQSVAWLHCAVCI